MKKTFWALLVIVIIVVFVSLFSVFNREARNDREWAEEFVRTPDAQVTDGVVTLTNLRDWTYAKDATLSRGWIDEVTVNPADITQVWFMVEPSPKLRAIAHTYLSFEFSDGAVLSLSVEARRLQGQNYSPLLGLFRKYELTYSWGMERDFLARRILLLGHHMYMYPLILKEGTAARLFLALSDTTADLAAHPRFYNTLTANCTDVLAKTVNRIFPHQLPYDLSWNFPGSSDAYLMRMGYIASSTSLAIARTTHDLAQYKDTISSFATSSQEIFNSKIRTLFTEN